MNVLKLLTTSLMSKELALAHQSADTLNTVISDKDMLPRLKPMISELNKFTIECMGTVNIPDYFDFVGEIIKYYSDSLSIDEIFVLLESMI